MSTAFAHITDVSALAEAIAQRCEQARQRGGRWEACCPAHDDTTPSLSIAAGTQTGSVVLMSCWLHPQAVVEALGSRWPTCLCRARRMGTSGS